jgi:hypothetical protein
MKHLSALRATLQENNNKIFPCYVLRYRRTIMKRLFVLRATLQENNETLTCFVKRYRITTMKHLPCYVLIYFKDLNRLKSRECDGFL